MAVVDEGDRRASLSDAKSSSGPAPRFYKFRAFSKCAMAGLANQELFFAAADRFNDPFDCQFDLIDEETDERERVDWIRTLESRRLAPPGSGEKAARLYDHPAFAYERFRATPREEYRRQREEFRAILAQLGICSFSARADSILMWSHYSEQHTGFCLEFSKLRDHLPEDVSLRQVCYREDVPSLSIARLARMDCEPLLEANRGKSFSELSDLLRNAQKTVLHKAAGRVVTEAVSTKHTDWAYEREWRAIVKRPNEVIRYPAQALTAVIFGMRSSSENREALREALGGPEWSHVELREAVRPVGRFAVEIRRL